MDVYGKWICIKIFCKGRVNIKQRKKAIHVFYFYISTDNNDPSKGNGNDFGMF